MASAREWWQKYQEALRSGDRKAAAEAFRRYQEAKRQEGRHSSRPIFVNLSTRAKDYRNAIPLDEIPDELERSSEFFDLMKRIATKET